MRTQGQLVTSGGVLRRQPSLVDIVAPRRPSTYGSYGPVLARWAALVVGAVVASGGDHSQDRLSAGLVLLAVAVVRSVQLVRPGPAWLSTHPASLATELVLAVGLCACTGGSRSPWLIAVVAEMVCVGTLVPSRWAGSAAAGGLIALFSASLVLRSNLLARGGTGLVALLPVAALTVAYASWVLARTERHRALLAKANERLANTNTLLVGLDHASPRGGDAFDPRRCARSIASTTRAVLHPVGVAVLASTALPGRWQVLHAEGAVVAGVVDDTDLPGGRLDADSVCDSIVQLEADTAGVVFPHRCSILRIPLALHDRRVGLLLLEHPDVEHWSDPDETVVAELAERAALMLDNARRFNALWVVGVTEERTRVAHDLHDHLGQSMAALGLELDILARRCPDPDTSCSLLDLRSRLTAMVGDLRGTMRDLRCDVSERRSLCQALESLVRDLDARSPAVIDFSSQGQGRMTLAQEHQLLLVARQAITSATTDAGAGHVGVVWCCDGELGRLEIHHDGGIADLADLDALATASHLDALRGIEDRCHAIGARFHSDVAGSIVCEVTL